MNTPPISSPMAGLRASTVLMALVGIVGIVIAAIVALSLGGDSTQQATVATIVALVTPILAGLILLLTKADQIHQLVNSTATAAELRNTQQQARNEQQGAKIDQLIRANEALGGDEPPR